MRELPTDHCIDNLDTFVFWVAGLSREHDFLRGLAPVYTGIVYTHTDVPYRNQALDGCFFCCFCSLLCSTNGATPMNLAAASQIWPRVAFTALLAAVFCPPLAALVGCQRRRDGPSRKGVFITHWFIGIRQKINKHWIHKSPLIQTILQSECYKLNKVG